MRIVGIDPGSDVSAWLVLSSLGVPLQFGIEPNNILLTRWESWAGETIAIEGMNAMFGMPMNREIYGTAKWIGQFTHALARCKVHEIVRNEVKLDLCGTTRAKDANIRSVLLDRFGGKQKAIGKKRSPGPLFGVKRDLYSALAVAIVCQDRLKAERSGIEQRAIRFSSANPNPRPQEPQ